MERSPPGIGKTELACVAALKRRCLHLHIPFPDQDMECRIVERRVPGFGARAALVAFVQSLRTLDLKKPPAISETIDRARQPSASRLALSRLALVFSGRHGSLSCRRTAARDRRPLPRSCR